MKKGYGQAAIEYLVLTGFGLLVLMVLLSAGYFKISQTQKTAGMSSAIKAANTLTEYADFAYAQGYPTRLKASIYLPPDVLGEPTSFISGNTINIAVDVAGEHTDVWRRTKGEVEWDNEGGSPFPNTEGYYVFYVESTDYNGPYGGTINIYR